MTLYCERQADVLIDKRKKEERDSAERCKTKIHNELTYDANSIVVIDVANLVWNKAVALASKYGFNAEHIARALMACDMANVTHDYYINRYLKKDGTPFDANVGHYMTVVLDEYRAKSQAA